VGVDVDVDILGQVEEGVLEYKDEATTPKSIL
jgi:hypothetical protein